MQSRSNAMDKGPQGQHSNCTCLPEFFLGLPPSLFFIFLKKLKTRHKRQTLLNAVTEIAQDIVNIVFNFGMFSNKMQLPTIFQDLVTPCKPEYTSGLKHNR